MGLHTRSQIVRGQVTDYKARIKADFTRLIGHLEFLHHLGGKVICSVDRKTKLQYRRRKAYLVDKWKDDSEIDRLRQPYKTQYR
jgi:hypothetical protein